MSAEPQVCSTAVSPTRAPRCLGSDATVVTVSAAAVLAYLSRCTHRVAIANQRLIAMDEDDVAFRYKDYRRDGDARHRTMTLSTDEFIRRFLVHILPKGFPRIRHYGLLATGRCKANIARARAPPPYRWRAG